MSSGLSCPQCGHPSRVVRSEATPSGRERQRVHKCRDCGRLFTSTERVDDRK